MTFITALAYHYCLAFPEAFTQPGDHLLISLMCITIRLERYENERDIPTRAIVHSNKQPRVESFSRLVSLGGGKVVKAEPPYSDPKDANHCLYEKVSNVFVDFKARMEYEVQPLRTSY